MPFCRSAAPFILESGSHGRAVAFQSCRQTLHLPNSALRHSFHPTRECFTISLLEDAVEFPRKDLRLGDLWRHYLLDVLRRLALRPPISRRLAEATRLPAAQRRRFF